MQVKKQQLEQDMEQQTGSKWKKSTSGLYGLQAEIKIARRNIKNIRYADDTTLMAESKEELKSLLMRVKENSEKSWLKTQY